MSRPFEFRGRGLAWEIYRDQIIFLTRSPLFFSAKAYWGKVSMCMRIPDFPFYIYVKLGIYQFSPGEYPFFREEILVC
jgi:hypothetical protein